jgi:hypothetical protein
MKILGRLLFMLIAAVATAQTQDTGTILKKDLKWSSKLPIDKTYEQFTPEEKAELRAMYPQLKPDDEPPYPLEGMKPIFSALKQAQHVLQARGELNMVVTVGPDGKAIKVEDFGGVYNAKMTELAQQVLLLTKYKPALCDGTPCAMPFPFQLKLKTS